MTTAIDAGYRHVDTARIYGSTLHAFDAGLERLGLEYVDHYLIHWPVGGKRLDAWRALSVARRRPNS